MAKTYINGIRVLVLNALMEKKQLMDQLVQEIVKNIIMYLALIVLYLIVIFFKVSQFHSPIAKQLIQIQIALNVIMDMLLVLMVNAINPQLPIALHLMQQMHHNVLLAKLGIN